MFPTETNVDSCSGIYDPPPLLMWTNLQNKAYVVTWAFLANPSRPNPLSMSTWFMNDLKSSYGPYF